MAKRSAPLPEGTQRRLHPVQHVHLLREVHGVPRAPRPRLGQIDIFGSQHRVGQFGSSFASIERLLDIETGFVGYFTDLASGAVEHAVLRMTAWYVPGFVFDWALGLAKHLISMSNTLAGLVDGALGLMLTDLLPHHRFRPHGAIDTAHLRRDVSVEQAVSRAADEYRFQQSRLDRYALSLVHNPAPVPPVLQSPRDAALARATSVARTQLQLAVAHQSAASLAAAAGGSSEIIGWRRVLRPELDKTGSCGLCIAASTRIYRTGELMPIHHDCHCIPMPVTAGADPGAQINDADLGRVYAAAGSTDAHALRETHFKVFEHGEIGPVLVPGSSRPRAHRQAAADTRSPRPLSEARKRARLERLHAGLSRSLQTVDGLAHDDPATWDGYRTTLAERVTQLGHDLAA